VEAVICDLRSSHRRWGPRRLVFELARRGRPDISRSTVYRVLVRRQLLEPVPRRRHRDQYRGGERAESMELWQLDVTASLFLADGRECKIITGIFAWLNELIDTQPWQTWAAALYRFRTHRRYCELRFGRMSRLRQDRGSCPFACST